MASGTRSRRSCLSVPGSNPKMLGKAASLPADEVFFDLEDSVAPASKEQARDNVIRALLDNEWKSKTVAVRINSIDTQWAAEDLRTVVGAAGSDLDCIMIPKVQHAHQVLFVDHMLQMFETNNDPQTQIGIEAQIETATGLKNIHEIAGSSARLETLVFGPADMSASLGVPSVSVGASMIGYPGDQWHWVLETILVAARAADLQAIDGPFLAIKDVDGLRASAHRSRALGFDGKWALHPTQIDVLNEIYSPTQDEYDKAEALLEAYRHAVEGDGRGAVMFGAEMIDEASRKMALRLAERGRAAGMNPSKSYADFRAEWESG
jgi:citrate lyase subunit beta / citryl-CoA lyase